MKWLGDGGGAQVSYCTDATVNAIKYQKITNNPDFLVVFLHAQQSVGYRVNYVVPSFLLSREATSYLADFSFLFSRTLFQIASSSFSISTAELLSHLSYPGT